MDILEGDNFHLQEYLGAPKGNKGEQEGFTFRVWAPNAPGGGSDWWFSLIGRLVKFQWFVMKEASGKSSVPMQKEGDIYKYLVTRQNGHQVQKIDPHLALWMEKRPNTGSIIKTIQRKTGKMVSGEHATKNLVLKERPVNIYEVHAGSWNVMRITVLYLQTTKKKNWFHIWWRWTTPRGIYASDGPSIGLELGLSAHGIFLHSSRLMVAQKSFKTSWKNASTYRSDRGLGTRTFHYQWCLGLLWWNITFEYQKVEHHYHNYGWGALNFDLGRIKSSHSWYLVWSFGLIRLSFCIGIRVDAVKQYALSWLR